jgi:hypothetical protein
MRSFEEGSDITQAVVKMGKERSTLQRNKAHPQPTCDAAPGRV